MPATAAIRVATRALRGCAAVCVLGVLCSAPAKALSFAWSFQITGASNNGYIGQFISGTIDNLKDNTTNREGMTATITSSPFGPGSGSWSTISLSYSGGNGIAVKDGVVDTAGLQAYFIYQGQDKLILQSPDPYSNNPGGSLEVFYPDPDRNSAWMNGSPPSFTAVPAPPSPPGSGRRHRLCAPVEAADCVEAQAGGGGR